jgi:hypothetical protein
MSVNHYARADEILGRVWRVRDLWRGLAVGQGALLYLALAAGSLLVATGVEGFLHSGPLIRSLLLVLVAAAVLAGLFFCVLRPAFGDVSDERVARLIELRFPELDNGLINAVQLARDTMVPSQALVERQIAEVADRIQPYDFRQAVDRRRLRRMGLWAAATTTALLVYAILFPARFANALTRILRPRAYLPAVGAVNIAKVEPGSTTLIYGSDLDVRVTLAPGSREVGEGTLRYQVEEGRPEELSLSAVGGGVLSGRVESVTVPLSYAVRVGDSESQLFTVALVQKPAVRHLEVTYEYPQYTGLTPRTEADSLGDLSAPVGSLARLTITANKPIATAKVLLGEGAPPPVTADLDKQVLRTQLWIEKGGTYAIHLTDEQGYTNDPPVENRIEAIPDAPPQVVLLTPTQDETAAPGGSVAVSLKASDNYGLERVELRLRRNDDPEQVAKSWEVSGRRDASCSETVQLPADAYHDGDTVTVYAAALDKCTVPGPGTGESQRVLIHIKDPAEARRRLSGQFAAWEEELRRILEAEKAARAASLELTQPMGPETFRAKVTPVREQQLDIRTRTLAVADEIDSSLVHLRPVKRALLALGSDDMVQAVMLTEALLAAENPPLVSSKALELLEVQKRIIDLLEKILGVLPELAKRTLEELEGREPSDLPSDVEQKLQELAKKLEEFIAQQKKVIEGSEDLRKKPVDDFTEEDLTKLRDLEAIEDNWAKFMKEAYADFSKLPVQDFANPSLLKEILEVQNDVQMAADALSQKTVEIAVPLEQSGLELAEQLTTHIEKWLDDKPDRLKWVMEEPLQDVEVPMAELPAELEDIVGDLMEQEEDLFQEAEDVTSAWADSLDKGAGWTAMDGPISNMSAQGVTGNVLPNTSEIGGRSGEGRTGKANGEFVEESATGKGGRRTPTRLSPDPFQAGQVNDQDKQPSGGATGGGKMSGAGGEGLEGPVPPQLSQTLQRLAGQQAELRNRAEAIQAQFKVANYPSYQLDEAVTVMEQVELDLRSARYRNALRQKPVLLESLRDTRAFLVGEVRMTYDRSAPLPPYLRDQLTDARAQKAPEGYEDLLKKYYERLSEKETPPQATPAQPQP